MAEEPEGEAGVLRIAVQGGGCSGFEYALGFDTGAQEGDHVLDVFGIQVVVDPLSAPYLQGTQIDFVDGLQGGFAINNPNVTSACGCGHSFQVEEGAERASDASVRQAAAPAAASLSLSSEGESCLSCAGCHSPVTLCPRRLRRRQEDRGERRPGSDSGRLHGLGRSSTAPNLPSKFPTFDSVTYTRQSTQGPTEIVEGYYEGDVTGAHDEVKAALDDAGFTVLFDELEEHDSEVSWKGQGRSGQVALARGVRRRRRTFVHITNRPNSLTRLACPP